MCCELGLAMNKAHQLKDLEKSVSWYVHRDLFLPQWLSFFLWPFPSSIDHKKGSLANSIVSTAL